MANTRECPAESAGGGTSNPALSTDSGLRNGLIALLEADGRAGEASTLADEGVAETGRVMQLLPDQDTPRLLHVYSWLTLAEALPAGRTGAPCMPQWSRRLGRLQPGEGGGVSVGQGSSLPRCSALPVRSHFASAELRNARTYDVQAGPKPLPKHVSLTTACGSPQPVWSHFPLGETVCRPFGRIVLPL